VYSTSTGTCTVPDIGIGALCNYHQLALISETAESGSSLPTAECRLPSLPTVLVVQATITTSTSAVLVVVVLPLSSSTSSALPVMLCRHSHSSQSLRSSGAALKKTTSIILSTE
jgi:hypothetical protein